MVQRAIVGYRQDGHGAWIAELACGHARHVRHRPPFDLRPWILDAEGRRRRLGTPIECGLCEQDAPSAPGDEVGESACYAHLLCPECGAVLDGGPHRPGCASAT